MDIFWQVAIKESFSIDLNQCYQFDSCWLLNLQY